MFLSKPLCIRTSTVRCINSYGFSKPSLHIRSAKVLLPSESYGIKRRSTGQDFVTRAQLKITEKETGIEFPLVQRFWEGTEFRCLGAAPRLKKILFLKAKVYAIALYVEPSKAAQELKLRDRGNFFVDAEPGAFCDAILDGAFDKILQITMVRDINSDQFVEAIDEALGAKLGFIGATDAFEAFKGYFAKQQLLKGSIILMHWRVNGDLDVSIMPKETIDFSQTERIERYSNPGFSRSMFELYMGSSSIIPEAQQAWADGAKRLLDSTRV